MNTLSRAAAQAESVGAVMTDNHQGVPAGYLSDAGRALALKEGRELLRAGQASGNGKSQMADGKRARTLNPTSLLNATAVRELALETWGALRPFHKKNRVAAAFLVEANEVLRRWIVSRVKGGASAGKTIT